MSKFRVGDVVRCVGAADSPFVEGAEYEVREAGATYVGVRGVRYTWGAARFELVRRAPSHADELELARLERDEALDRVQELEAQLRERDRAPLQVGDWVECVDASHVRGVLLGGRYQVSATFTSVMDGRERIKVKGRPDTWLYVERFKRCAEPPTFPTHKCEAEYREKIAALEARLRHVQAHLQAVADACELDSAFAPDSDK